MDSKPKQLSVCHDEGLVVVVCMCKQSFVVVVVVVNTDVVEYHTWRERERASAGTPPSHRHTDADVHIWGRRARNRRSETPVMTPVTVGSADARPRGETRRPGEAFSKRRARERVSRMKAGARRAARRGRVGTAATPEATAAAVVVVGLGCPR